jgi:hypothetical protein
LESPTPGLVEDPFGALTRASESPYF